LRAPGWALFLVGMCAEHALGVRARSVTTPTASRLLSSATMSPTRGVVNSNGLPAGCGTCSAVLTAGSRRSDGATRSAPGAGSFTSPPSAGGEACGGMSAGTGVESLRSSVRCGAPGAYASPASCSNARRLLRWRERRCGRLQRRR